MVKIDPAWKITTSLPSRHIEEVLTYSPAYYLKRLEKIGFTGKNSRILDAGCGAGIFTVAASRLNKQVKAIDATDKYLAVAKEITAKLKLKNIELRQGKIESLPYPDNYFDFIICYDVWMYTNRLKSLQEMFRVLKPGGKIYLGLIAGLGWYLDLIWQGIRDGKPNLIRISLKAINDRVFTPLNETEELLQKTGFKLLAQGADGQAGDKKIKITPIFPDKKFGFWDTYEVLAEKKERTR